jgi:hypothetical protein
MSPSSLFFSMCENASQKIYPMPQLEMPKIFKKIFEASLAKSNLGTSSCPFVVSSK